MSSGAENYTTNVFGTKICFLKFHILLALEILQPDEELLPNLITTMLLENQRHVNQFHFLSIHTTTKLNTKQKTKNKTKQKAKSNRYERNQQYHQPTPKT